MKGMKLHSATAICTAAVLMGSAHAQSLYQQKLSVDMGVGYDTNPAMAANAHSVSRFRLSPRYTLLRREGVDELRLNLGAALEQSSDVARSQNRKDPDAQVQWQHESEATTYVMTAGYQQTALRDALLEETGQVAVDGTRKVRSLGVSVMHQLNALYRTSGGVQAAWTNYSRAATPDSRQLSASAELSRALDQGKEVFLAGDISSFVPDQMVHIPGAPSNSSVMRSAVLGYRSPLADTLWQWEVRGGVASYTGPFSDTTPKGDLRLSYNGQRWNTSVSLSYQPVTDTLRGSFSQNQQFRWSAGYAWDEVTRITLDASHNRTQSTQRTATNSVGLSVSRELTPLWRLGFNMRHTRVNRAVPSTVPQASGSSVGVTLAYTHPDF